MKAGMAVVLPVPCNWAIEAAWAAAASPGRPRVVSEPVTAERNCDVRTVVRIANPRLAP
jgi:hypothetical protein